MKQLICLTILVAITTQSIVGVSFHNPLKDRSFSISYNRPENKHINGVEVFFTDSRITFRGCNTNWASYTLKASGEFSITSLWGSTKRACSIDYDSDIRKLFSDTTKVQQLTIGRVDFFKGIQILLILSPKQPIQPLNALAGRSLLIQSTALGIDAIVGIQVSFTDTTISFTGCNKNSASYSVRPNDKFSIDSIWIGTLRGCSVDYDSSITHLFSSSTRYALRSDGGVTLFDQKSALIQLGPKQEIQPFSPLFGKKFVIAQTSLNKDSVIGTQVGFSKATLSFKGCNHNFAPFTAGNNKFSVNGDQWASTYIYCQVDNDGSIRQLFTKSKSFEVCQNGSITFSDERSKLTLRLNIKQQIQPLTLVGDFTITYNSLSIPAINGVQVNFSSTTVSFKQCNKNTAGYSIGANNSFDITSIWQGTMLACLFPDFDREIGSLFENSVRFENTTNGRIFFDANSRLLLQLTSNK